MKKETHPVRPVPSEDYEIRQFIEDDGSIAYQHPIGNSVKVMQEDLPTFFQVVFDRMDTLIGLLDDEDYGRLGCLFDFLNAQAHRQIHEACEFLAASVGDITLDIVSRGDFTYRSGRVVGVNLDRSRIVKAKQGKQEQ
jgi:hypothetical protein